MSWFKKEKEVFVKEEVIWIDIDVEKPDDVVLGACDTSDCGWVIETMWWYDDKNCWYNSAGPTHSLVQITT